VSSCGSPTLLSIRSRLFEQADRYVALSIMSSGPFRDDVTEHKQLMKAALNREIDKTLELNRVHINRTLDKVSASLATNKAPADLRVMNRKSRK
jgi:DNA-binding GntR family transcriptional regulator